MYFEWDNDLATGFEDIDKQHQGLIAIINDALQLSFSNDVIEINTIKEIYDNLTKYVVEHFDTEEDLMKNCGVDSRHIDLHLKLHTEFKDSVKHYFSNLSSLEKPEKLGEVIAFLIRWLAYHILSIDKSLARQMNYIKIDNESAVSAYEKEQSLIETSAEPLLKALKALFYMVSEKNKDLERLNNELEEKVEMRTEELRQAYEKLVKISMQDELTSLFNRRYAVTEIEKLIGNWKRYGATFSVLFIDVDKFKLVNDNYGHEYGDKVLIWIADFLKNSIRKTDIACRLGGDEFLVISSYCNAEAAICLARKLNYEIKEHVQEEITHYWNPSLSIGVAEVNENCQTVSEVLNKADGAMYLAKNSGGDSSNLAI